MYSENGLITLFGGCWRALGFKKWNDIFSLYSQAVDSQDFPGFLTEKIPAERGYSKKLIDNALIYDILESQKWPGNVRDLERCLKNAVLFSDGQNLTKVDILKAINDTNSSSILNENTADPDKKNEKIK